MAAAPELEPVVVFTLKRAIKPLALLCGFVVAWGICKVLDRFVRALFGTLEGSVGWIPFLGRIATMPIHRIEQKVSNALGDWADRLEGDIADAFHQLAAMVRQLGAAIRNAPLLLYDVVRLLGTFLSYRSWQQFYKTLRGYDRATLAQAKAAGRTAHATSKTATHAAKVATHAQARAVALPGEIGRTWDIPGLRERVGELEQGGTRLWHWIRSHGRTVAAGAFVGAVVYALGKVGAGWIRCSNWKRAGRQICGTDPSLIDSLLADTLLIAGTLSLVEFARAMAEVEDLIADGIVQFWRAK